MTIDKFIDSEEIISEVRDFLSSYFDQGVLDESFFYRRIKTCLERMGIRIMPIKKELINIKNYEGSLPSDIYKINLAMICLNKSEWIKTETGYYDKLIKRVEVPSEDSCFPTKVKNCYQMNHYAEYQTHTWTESHMLTPFEKSMMCTSSCWQDSKQSAYSFRISNGKIILGEPLKEGQLFIEYLASLDSGTSLSIPDKSEIIEWIKAELYWVSFEKMYSNGENDSLQRMQYWKREATTKELRAMDEWKKITKEDLFDLKKSLSSQFKTFTKVYGGR